jgi:serine/threonine protein phosphatase PrpC
MVTYAASTVAGAVRELNEDAVLADTPLFVVADGMGGHAAGEVASALALQQLAALRGQVDVRPEGILTAIEAANQSILDWSAARPETLGMGTTLSGVCLGEVGGSPHWFVFNVGDSRVYRYAAGSFAQVTTDHSEVEELVLAGRISAEEARGHPRRNVVTRSLGTDPAPTPDIWVLPAGAGETFLICSDGLPLEVEDSDIAAVLARELPPQEAVNMLVDMALAAGGRDNVSVVVVSVPASSEPQPVDVSTAPRHRAHEESE